MCLICLELEKLTFIEAARNIREMAPTMDEEHRKEVLNNFLVKKAVPYLDNYELNETKDVEDLRKHNNEFFKLLDDLGVNPFKQDL